ncbi:hypothetical protein EUTSA_v10017543mg [Eutrema salsugineum]|uniref:F-box domain-containing protein n=1 Tax=Eutrema salsugineum TaxID=72664 RepID=V4M6J7_EUTSA|nr:putative F-box protein At2g33200 [Eutrema salsugineum]ESQ51909.1 hypothetical protein EUTSA_v10017543mg [Eutrema salsugineum]
MSRIRYDWSKLCPDLLVSILEGLGTNDFHRARTVCSDWYSVSRTCMRPLYPWLILFSKHSTLFLDPGKDEIHEIEHPGVDFLSSYVMASCSNWLLIADSRQDLYLLNVFTRERIDLPSMDSALLGHSRFQRKEEWKHFINLTPSNISACLWMNERTGEYVVAWSFKKHYLFSYKRGDDSWCDIQGTSCESMAYKNKKLYVYTSDGYIKILDISGDSPHEILEGNPYLCSRFCFVSQPVWRRRVAITNSGEVLIALSLKGLKEEKGLFYIFKMNVRNGKWERVDSLGGEMLIFGHGLTIRAPVKVIDGEGIKSDSVCFMGDDLWPGQDYFNTNRRTKCGVFDLAKSSITWPKTLDDSFLKSSWFVPGHA